MLMVGFNESIINLATVRSMQYGHVLCREDGHVLRRVLEFEAEGHRSYVMAEEVMEEAG